MFFFETFAFVLVFPICWWLGGRIARAESKTPPVRPRAPDEAEVVDLDDWRRRHGRWPTKLGAHR